MRLVALALGLLLPAAGAAAQEVASIGGDDLQAEGIDRLGTMARETAGLSVRSGGPGRADIAIRGIGGAGVILGNGLANGQGDGPMFNSATAIDPDLFDLNRIETLRGPQSTLYGAGAMSGVLRLVPNPPDLRILSAGAATILSGTEGGGPGGAEKGMVNVPLVQEKLALRLVETGTRESAWTQSNATHHEGARAEILFQPQDRLSVSGSVLWQRITQADSDTIGPHPAAPFADRLAVYDLSVTYDLEGARLSTSVSEWSRAERQGALNRERQAAEEIRLSSTGEGPFQYLAGLSKRDFRSTFLRPGKFEESAIFGRISYRLAEQVTAAAGLRWTDGGPHLAPEASLSYQPEADRTFYIRLAEGYRPVAWGAGTLWSTEIGEQVKLFDRRLTLDGALYTENRRRGGELEAEAQITSSWSLTGSLGTMDAPEGADFPRWTGSAAVLYTTTLTADYNFLARLADDHTGARRSGLPADDLSNFRMGLIGEQWSGFIVVDNLTNRRASLSSFNPFFRQMPVIREVTVSRPRTYGVEVNYRF